MIESASIKAAIASEKASRALAAKRSASRSVSNRTRPSWLIQPSGGSTFRSMQIPVAHSPSAGHPSIRVCAYQARAGPSFRDW